MRSKAVLSSKLCKGIHRKHLVSFVVVNWNGSGFLKECIRSIKDQDYRDIEVILIDNGSTDGSAEDIANDEREIKVVFAKYNLGFAKACNLGVSLSKGDIIAFLNNDATIPKDWISKMSCVFDCAGAQALTCPVFYYSNPAKYWYNTSRFDALTGLSWSQGQVDSADLEDFDSLTGCAMVIKKSLFLKAGGFDEGYFLYDDDLDLSFKLARLGETLYFVRDTYCSHRISAGKKLAPKKVYFYKQKSDIRLCLKNLPFPYLITSTIFRSVVMPIVEAIVFRRGPDAIVISARACIVNLYDLRNIITSRHHDISNFGNLKVENRFKEVVRESVGRLRSGTLFW